MMFTDPMLWRVVWKEYRAQRGFWLSVAGFAVTMMLLWMWLLDELNGRFAAPWAIALGMPALYALGSAAILFASEREEGTTDFLRIMAARPGRVFLGKVGFTIVSTLAICGTLLAAARILTWGLPDRFASDVNLAIAEWITLELLVWGFFFSTVCTRVLTAVCFAAFVPLLVKFLLQETLYRVFGRLSTTYEDLVLLIPVFAASFVVWRRTMAGRSRAWSVPQFSSRSRQSGNVLERLAAARETAPAWRRTFTRLVWLELRQALTIGHLLWIGGILLLAFAPWIFTYQPNQSSLASILLAPTLIGVWTFQAEQGRRTRFLAEHGLSPHAVWLSRQLIWLFVAAAVVAPCLVAVELANAHHVATFKHTFSSMFHEDVPGASAVVFALALAVLGYGSGQLASMLIPRSVTAGFIGFVIYWLLSVWAWFMAEMAVPYLLAVAPLVAIMLAATLVWSRRWLLEQTTWQAWTRLALTMAFSVVAVWGGVGVYRVFSVPSPEALWRPYEVALALEARAASGRRNTREEIETAHLYEQAIAQFRMRVQNSAEDGSATAGARSGWAFAHDHQRLVLTENGKALENFLAATERANCAFSEPLTTRSDAQVSPAIVGSMAVAKVVLLSARELEADGKLDDALERYLAVLRFGRHVASHGGLGQWIAGESLERMCGEWLPLWAAHPDQTPERLDAGMRRVVHELDQYPSLRDALAVDQFIARREIAGNWNEDLPITRPYEGWNRFALALFGRWFPWEKSRALRMLDLITVAQWRSLESLDENLATIQNALQMVRRDAFVMNGRLATATDAELPWQLAAATPVLKLYGLPEPYVLWEAYLLREATRRALVEKLRAPPKPAEPPHD
jgi:hypothetical protein